jgi:hypothetical protein
MCDSCVSENSTAAIKFLHYYPFYAEACFNNIKNSVLTPNRMQCFTIASINWLMLFKEIIPVYAENYMKCIIEKSNADC